MDAMPTPMPAAKRAACRAVAARHAAGRVSVRVPQAGTA